MKTETRVYLIDLSKYQDFDVNSSDDPIKMDDDAFITEAERQGNVWSLDGFQRSWNDEEVPYDSYMRIVDVEMYDENSTKTKVNF